MSTANEYEGSTLSAAPSRGDLESRSKEIISKHDSIYFENGNIVLLSLPKDSIVTAFKVYKDFLMLHSPVFEDMLSMPQPPDVKEFDNVPLVKLQDETSHLIPFLQAIYDPTAVPTIRDFYLSFNKVESVFKLSKKYQCDKLLKFMRDALSAIRPKDLLSWDNIMANGKTYTGFLLGQHNLESSLPEPSSAIRLARDFDVPEILPAAFYYLRQTSLRAFHNDGCKDTINGDLSAEIERLFAHLSHGDLVCFIRGSYAIREFMCDIYTTASVPATCSVASRCNQVLPLFVTTHKIDAAYLDADALEVLEERKIPTSAQPSNLMLCGSCRARYITLMKESRAKLWDLLPVLFGLTTTAV